MSRLERQLRRQQWQRPHHVLTRQESGLVSDLSSNVEVVMQQRRVVVEQRVNEVVEWTSTALLITKSTFITRTRTSGLNSSSSETGGGACAPLRHDHNQDGLTTHSHRAAAERQSLTLKHLTQENTAALTSPLPRPSLDRIRSKRPSRNQVHTTNTFTINRISLHVTGRIRVQNT